MHGLMWLREACASMPVDLNSLDLPAGPGVYLFKNHAGRVLYVGKATDLQTRVRAYFSPSPDRKMVPILLQESDWIDCIVTPTASDALVLERELIREHRPRHNSMLKDDKSYPWIALTKHAIPRLQYTRNPPPNSRLWGPFPDAGSAKKLVQLLRREFGLRDCNELLEQGCLSMHIGLCSAPCINDSGYLDDVNAAAAVLDGNAKVIKESLLKEMDAAADLLNFERAAVLRDTIAKIQRMLSQNVVSSKFYQECDAMGIATAGDLAVVSILHANNCVVGGKTDHVLRHSGDDVETFERCIDAHYEALIPPPLVLLPAIISAEIKDELSIKRGSSVEIRIPRKGDLAILRKLADQNAQVRLERAIRRHPSNDPVAAAKECAEALDLESLERLVCFDLAQLQGIERVGASIEYHHGKPEKAMYRKFTIRSDALDDLSMMREMVGRWLNHQSEYPDLMLIDGGKTHLKIIYELLQEKGLSDRIPLGALAKKEEILHRVGYDPWKVDKRGRILIMARDEAHRFTNHHHRTRRKRRHLKDPLSEILGLGPKRQRNLLRALGGRSGIEKAGIEQLSRVEGIGKELAARIYQHIHPKR